MIKHALKFNTSAFRVCISTSLSPTTSWAGATPQSCHARNSRPSTSLFIVHSIFYGQRMRFVAGTVPENRSVWPRSSIYMDDTLLPGHIFENCLIHGLIELYPYNLPLSKSLRIKFTERRPFGLDNCTHSLWFYLTSIGPRRAAVRGHEFLARSGNHRDCQTFKHGQSTTSE